MADLTDPLAKLDRAEEHLLFLDEKIGSYRGHYVEIGSKFDPEAGCHIVKVSYTEYPPLYWGILIGDLVHNLRSALDHLVWQLVLANGKRLPDKYNAFPIARIKDEWKGAMRRNYLRGVGEDQRTEIQSVQPYKRTDIAPETHPLAVLDDLWNHDKHRIVTERYMLFSDDPPGISVPEGVRIVRIERPTGNRAIEADAEIARVWLDPPSPEAEVGVQGNSTFKPAFGDRYATVGDLRRLGAVVADILKRPAFAA